ALVDEASVGFGDNGRTFAGQADDAFFLDLRVFDLLYGGDLSEVGQDTLAGYNTNTLAIQVPKSHLALKNDVTRNPVIGVWSDTEQQTLDLRPAGESELTGDHVQISRLGQPLVNEVVIPTGLKDAFNGITPAQDADIQPVVDRVLDPELPKLIEAIYELRAPAAPRNDIFEVFLTGITNSAGDEINVGNLNSQMDNADAVPFRPSEMTRLNMTTPVTQEPNRLGVIGGDLQGFPNGRRLTDDVLDIEILALEGALRPEGAPEALAGVDAVDVNDVPFLDRFPYVGTAQNEGVNVTFGGGEGGGAGAVPPGSWISFPSAPVVTGVAALALLGTGVFMLRRRPDFMSTRGNTVPVTE
ncbi:MAG: DUF4331 domain-containing protein, partial [Actinomycetota bacterium]|nr:DUF4331 domain-containing protein [Actinomycetota bacterium]